MISCGLRSICYALAFAVMAHLDKALSAAERIVTRANEILRPPRRDREKEETPEAEEAPATPEPKAVKKTVKPKGKTAASKKVKKAAPKKAKKAAPKKKK